VSAHGGQSRHDGSPAMSKHSWYKTVGFEAPVGIAQVQGAASSGG
jgi:hypothetical protein